MKRLSEHIISLLRSYDKVAIPGFGFFFLEYHPATFDPSAALFRPPFYALHFYRNDAEEGVSILAESYRLKEGATEAEAIETLNHDVTLLRKKLLEEGIVYLPGVGSFLKSDSDIFFEAELAFNFGLPVVALEKEKISETPDLSIKEYTDEVEEQEIPTGYHYHKPHYYYIPIHKAVANIAASMLLVIIVAIATIFPISQSQSSSSTAHISPVNLTEKSASEVGTLSEKNLGSIEEPKERNQSEATPAVENTSESPAEDASQPLASSQSSVHNFYAVVAAFKSDRQVEAFIKDNNLSADKIEVVRNGSYNLVTLASTSTKDEMQSILPEIRSAYPDAWIFEKR